MSSETTLKIWPTSRGFMRGEFVDFNGEECSIQESALATDACLWLGTDKNRMHLTQAMAVALIPLLQRFVDTGELQEPADAK